MESDGLLPPTRRHDVSVGGEFVTCTSCGLEHGPRPDGQCPRCHAAQDPNGAPLPARPLAQPPSARLKDRGARISVPADLGSRNSGAADLGTRICGAYFVLSAVLSALNRDNLPRGIATWVGVGLGSIVGIGLLQASSTSRSYRPAGQVGPTRRAVGVIGLALVGAVVMAFLHLPGLALVFIGVGIANGMLMLGRVSMLRIVLASTYLGLLLALGALALARNTFALELGNKLARNIQGEAVTEVKGRARGYQLRLPPSARWFEAGSTILKQGLLAKADRVLLSPGTDAWLIMTIEQLPKANIRLRDAGEVLLNLLRSTSTSFEVVEREDLPGRVPGLLLHTRHLERKQSYTRLSALMRKGKTLYLLDSITRTADYPKLADELRTTIDGFVPEDEPEPEPTVETGLPHLPSTALPRTPWPPSPARDDPVHPQQPVPRSPLSTPPLAATSARVSTSPSSEVLANCWTRCRSDCKCPPNSDRCQRECDEKLRACLRACAKP